MYQYPIYVFSNFVINLSSSTKISLFIFWLECYWIYGFIREELITYWLEVFLCWKERQSTMGPEHLWLFLLLMPKMQVPDDSLPKPLLRVMFAVSSPEGWENISPQKKSRLASIFYESSGTSLFLSYNSIHYVCSHLSWVLCIALVGLGGLWEQTQASMNLSLLLFFFSVTNVFCLSS